MHPIFSPICLSKPVEREGVEEALFSVKLRMSLIVLGVLSFSAGILAIYNVPVLSHLGTAGASFTLSLGCLSLMLGTCIKWVRAQKTLRLVQKEERTLQADLVKTEFWNTHIVPKDVWSLIFSELRPKNLVNCTSVCKHWKEIANSEKVLNRVCEKDPHLSDLKDIVESGACTWKEAFRYAGFSFLLSRFSAHELCHENSKLLEYNPQLTNYPAPLLFVSQFFAKQGVFTFFINNLNEIRIEKSSILFNRLKADETLTHLAVEDEYLFGLSEEDTIIQWHYPSGSLVQRIQTPANLINDGRESTENFCAIKGFIIKVSQYKKFQICEVFPSSSPSDKQEIKIENDRVRRFLIDEKKLFIACRDSIVIWDLEKKETIRIVNPKLDWLINDIKIIKNFLYLSTYCRLLAYDIATGQLVGKYSKAVKKVNLVFIEVIDSILYGVGTHDQELSYTNSRVIWAIDLKNDKLIGIIEKIFDITTFQAMPGTLKRLVDFHQAAKAHLH